MRAGLRRILFGEEFSIIPRLAIYQALLSAPVILPNEITLDYSSLITFYLSDKVQVIESVAVLQLLNRVNR